MNPATLPLLSTVAFLGDGSRRRFTHGLLHPFERLWAVMNLDMAHPQKNLPSGSSVYTSVGFATLPWGTYMAWSTDSPAVFLAQNVYSLVTILVISGH